MEEDQTLVQTVLGPLGPQILNGLSKVMKSVGNLKSFKLLIRQWNGPEFKCNTYSSFQFIQQ